MFAADGDILSCRQYRNLLAHSYMHAEGDRTREAVRDRAHLRVSAATALQLPQTG